MRTAAVHLNRINAAPVEPKSKSDGIEGARMRDGFCLIKLRNASRAMRFLLLILRCVLAFHGSHPSLNRTQHDCYEVVSQKKYNGEKCSKRFFAGGFDEMRHMLHDRLGENVAELSKIQKRARMCGPKFWMAPRVGIRTYNLSVNSRVLCR